jgi:diaminopimelate epimerase
MSELSFTKCEATGNDFLVVLDLDDDQPIDRETAAALCDRRFGVGADGTIRILRGDAGRFAMDHRNADGSPSRMCGNGVRCVAAVLRERRLIGGDRVEIETPSGVRPLELHMRGDDVTAVTVDMGAPSFARSAIPMRGPAWETFLSQPFAVGDVAFTASALSMGNPHLVLLCDEDPDRYHVAHIGPVLERHDLFPERTNVEFARVDGDEIRVRVWERGVGETMACGTGACAALVAANEAGALGPQGRIRFPGGVVDVRRSTSGAVLMTGPAGSVFEGSVDPEAVRTAAEARRSAGERAPAAVNGVPEAGTEPPPDASVGV